MNHSVRLLLKDEDIALLDAGGQALIRQGDYSRGIKLCSLFLRIRSQVGFKCDIDESGGLAELYDLNGYSKKVKR